MHNARTTPANPQARMAGGRPAADPMAYTLDRAAAACGLSRSTLYRHAKAGRLRLLRVGGRTLVDAASLRTLIGATA
jgi:excisionase family DNA binding protein